MSRGLRVAGFAALLLAAAALAFGPLASAGFVGEDLPDLVDAAASAGGAPARESDAGAIASTTGGGLARASLSLSRAIWARDGTWGEGSAIGLRLENLLLLLGSAAFARLALRRTLAPWTGLDGARAAAGACALLLACHPLAVAAVASVGARGDLLALFLGAAAAAAFLRGRQEREPPWTIAAGVCVLAAAFASSSALLAPPLLAGLELFSGRRGRPASVRLRTAATTLAVFGSLWLAATSTGEAAAPLAIPRWAEGLRDVARDLGRIALPADAGFGALGPLLLGALLLAALQPALVAARSAPRLWGWLSLSAAAGLVLPLFLRAGAQRDPDGPLSAVSLLPAVAVACAVLAVASTSLSGLRRVLLPGMLAASFVFFARAAAAPWIEASGRLAELRSDLARVRAAHGGEARILLVDPPERVAGLEVAGPSLGLLLHPSLCPTAEASDTGSMRGLSRGALLALVREPEFAELREGRLVLLLPPAPGDRAAERTAVVVPPPRPTTGSLAWRDGLRSPRFDVDPLEKRALRAEALPEVSTAQAPRMSWRAGEAQTGSQTGSRTGVWVAGRDAPTAVFDLSSDPEWLFGERVQRVSLEPEVGRIASAELARDVLPLSLNPVPEERAGSLVFRLDPQALPRPVHGEARLVLVLLDLRDLRYVEVPASIAADPARAEIVFPVPAGLEVPREGKPTLAWSLELRAGDACFARASGRR